MLPWPNMEKPALDLGACAEPSVGSARASDHHPHQDGSLVLQPLLASVVHNQVVPRLMLAHHLGSEANERADEGVRPTFAEIEHLADLAVERDTTAAFAEVQRLFRAGCSHAAVLIDLIGGAARLLGDQWLDDRRTFAEVTLGLGTLQRVVALTRHWLSPPITPTRGPVVLSAAPGEQHTLGIAVVGDVLAHAGWDVDLHPAGAPEELVATVSSRPVLAVGLTVSCASLVQPLGRLVADLREASLNRDLMVLVGSALDLEGYAKHAGAVYCRDAQSALLCLESQARLTV